MSEDPKDQVAPEESAEFMIEKLGRTRLELLFAVTSIESLVLKAKERVYQLARENGDDDNKEWWDAMYTMLVHYALYSDMLKDVVDVFSPLVEKNKLDMEPIRDAVTQLDELRVGKEVLTPTEDAIVNLLHEVFEESEPLIWGYGTSDIN